MTGKIRVMIVDDEPIGREGVRAQLEADPGVEIVAECRNGLEAVPMIWESAPDLIFLDVQMPLLDGFGVVETVGAERMPAVIFVTAYDRYALQAFEVNAVDYLLKPFDAERFSKALQRAKAGLQRRSVDDLSRRLQTLLDALNPGPHYLQRLVVKSAGRIFFLNVEEVDWAEAADNYVSLHVGRESHLIRETVAGLEAKLDPQLFLRIRHSTIVNIQRIKELHPLFNGEYEIRLHDGTALTSSRRYRQILAAVLGE